MAENFLAIHSSQTGDVVLELKIFLERDVEHDIQGLLEPSSRGHVVVVLQEHVHPPLRLFMLSESQADETFELANRAFSPWRIFVEGDPD